MVVAAAVLIRAGPGMLVVAALSRSTFPRVGADCLQALLFQAS